MQGIEVVLIGSSHCLVSRLSSEKLNRPRRHSGGIATIIQNVVAL